MLKFLDQKKGLSQCPLCKSSITKRSVIWVMIGLVEGVLDWHSGGPPSRSSAGRSRQWIISTAVFLKVLHDIHAPQVLATSCLFPVRAQPGQSRLVILRWRRGLRAWWLEMLTTFRIGSLRESRATSPRANWLLLSLLLLSWHIFFIYLPPQCICVSPPGEILWWSLSLSILFLQCPELSRCSSTHQDGWIVFSFHSPKFKSLWMLSVSSSIWWKSLPWGICIY